MNEKISDIKNGRETNSADTARKIHENVPRFGKGQILRSEKYSARRDALTILLKDGCNYSLSEVDRILDEFLKGKVK